MKVYEIIKKYIDSKGIKQSFISIKTGILENRLSMFFTGKRKISPEELVAICIAVEIDMNILKQKKEINE